jgi:hypothetical protein
MRRSIMCKRVFVLLLVLGLAANASAGLVASYDMEEGSGTTIADGTTNNYDGTLDATYTPGFTAGKVGSYALDNTTSDMAYTTLGTWDPGNTFYISSWLKWKGMETFWESPHGWSSRGQVIIEKADGWSSGTVRWRLFLTGPIADPGVVALWNARGNRWNSSLRLTADAWQYLEVYYDDSAGVAGMRLDGGAWDTSTWNIGADTGATVKIGTPGTTKFPYSYNGYIDDMKIYDIPEPATIALLGLGGLLLRRRR